MVREPPRQLSIIRRGTFFEDPFFRPAWGDYSQAVRRIVDRFNDGWVSPSERWQDSQYHSMYRTLRTARLNYSNHAAKFKEDGQFYKLVMDVREFIGGDITVRTAGPTVSVRGKMEVGACEGRRDRSSDRFPISGQHLTAKTLHRRFTLPADADCDKVESSLSKDAVLTVTIPKRSNVHYIPVRMEEGVNKENEFGSSPMEGPRQPGVKRPSESPLVHRRKKSQDESFNRHLEDGEKEHHRSRARDSEGKRRRKDAERSTEGPGSGIDSSDRRSRRREKKYEDVHEILIPIRMEPSDEMVHRRTSSSHIEPVREQKTSQSDSTNKISTPKSTKKYDLPSASSKPQSDFKSSINQRKNASVVSDDSSSVSTAKPTSDSVPTKSKLHSEWRNRQLNKLTSITKDKPLQSYSAQLPEESVLQSSIEDKVRNIDRPKSLLLGSSLMKSNLQEDASSSDASSSVNVDTETSSSDSSFIKVLDMFPVPEKVDITNGSSTSEETFPVPEEVESASGLSTSEENISKKNEMNGKSDGCTDSEDSHDIFINENDSLVHDSVDSNEMTSSLHPLSRNSLNPHFLTPNTAVTQSPCVTPGGRDVHVEKRHSLMEENMFKDCWSDFSNTLQDVLSRLQELSSELGNSKLLSSSTKAEDSEDSESDEASTTPCKASAGGVGRDEGGIKDGTHNMQSGQGRDLQRVQQKEALKRPLHMPVVDDAPVPVGESMRAKVPRPLSLPLDQVLSESPPRQERPSRPTSLFLSSDVSSSLIPGLSKDSPVEALQNRFHQWRSEESLLDGRESKLDGRDKVGGVSARSVLSPAEMQSSIQSQSGAGVIPSKAGGRRSKLPSRLDLDATFKGNSDETSISLNDLGRKVKISSVSSPEDDSVFTRNIDNNSPESNVSEDDSDSVQVSPCDSAKGSLKFPHSEDANNVVSLANSESSDVIDLSAKPIDDVMGCERHFTPFKDRRSYKTVQEDKYHGGDSMGSLFSRGGTTSSTPPTKGGGYRTVKTPPTLPAEEKPPYVRQKVETPRKFSGFGHVNSDNVRRMRDVWGGVRPDSKLPPSPKPQRGGDACYSPLSTRRFSNYSNISNLTKNSDPESPRLSPCHTPPNERSRSSPFRRSSPSPVRSTGSPLHFTYPDPPVRTPDKRSSSVGNKQQQPSSPSYHNSRFGSRGRASPSPSSSPVVTRRNTQGIRDSPPRTTSRTTSSRTPLSPLTSTKVPSSSSPLSSTRNSSSSSRSTSATPKTTSSASTKPTSDKRTNNDSSSRRRSSEAPKVSRTSPPSPAATKAHHKLFKRLRDANLQPDSEAICFKEVEDQYKMILDVAEFVPGEVDVLQDDRILTVKGKVETSDRGGHVTVKTFNRTFDIPKNSKEEDIDSALSKDGILTIFVPKKRERVIKIELVD